MNILVAGAKGFVGRNLIENLKNIKEGKNRTRPEIIIGNIYEYDFKTDTIEHLDRCCSDCDYVFDLTNLSQNKTKVGKNNQCFSSALVDSLKRHGNRCYVIRPSEQYSSFCSDGLHTSFDDESGLTFLEYFIPHLVGKWVDSGYHSEVVELCDSIANGRQYSVENRKKVVDLLFIDDFVNEMFDALEGHPHRCDYPVLGSDSSDPTAQWDGVTPIPNEKGRFCYVPITHKSSLGTIVDYLESFRRLNESFIIPEVPTGSLAYKLFSMYLSYLPEERMSYPLKMNTDERGTFTELLKTVNNGQVSINIARPGNVRGQHWHNTKWEIFIVVSGHALIQERKIGINPETGKEYKLREFEVYGEEMKAVIMLPGYAHNIINLENDKDLVTVMWANESFDPEHPDTFREEV